MLGHASTPPLSTANAAAMSNSKFQMEQFVIGVRRVAKQQ
jgi:hypothetical protein